MDGLVFLGILVVLALLAIPVGVIVLFFRTTALRERMDRMERQWADRPRVTLPVAATEAAPAASVEDPALSDPAVSDIIASAADDPRIADVPDEFRDPQADAVAPQPDETPWDRAVGRSGTEPGRIAAEMRITGDDPTERSAPLPPAPDRISALFEWLRLNWIYAISAASLGLAGIFFVQYGMERGLLPPAARVIMGILFGAALVAVGEWLRRRHGDEGETTTLYLPSVFSGAGLVSIFAALLAARHLYGLITPEVAFAGQLFTAALAVALGWFYGPLLAAVGLIGAALSPFIVGGGSDAAPWLYAYFALITAVGLGVDAVRRWGWVAILSLILGYGGAFLMMGAGAGDTGWSVFLIVIAAMAVVIPPLALTPRHPGPFTLQTLLGQSGTNGPGFAVRLALGSAIASTVFLCLQTAARTEFPLLAPLMLAAMAVAYLLWARRAEGLADVGVVPALGFLAAVLLQSGTGQPAAEGQLFVTLIVAMAVAISMAAAWRALRQQDWLLDLMFGLTAVLTAALTVAMIELFWMPARFIGDYVWATHIIGVAALMTGLATRFAAVDQGDMRRTAHAVLAALSLIALAMFLLTTATALTLALAVLVVVAAALDRRFGLPEMGVFIQVGVAVLTFRLLADPGLDWALEGPIWAVILAFAGSIAAMIAARWLVAPRERALTMAVLESAAAGLAAIFANVLITRWLIPEVQMGQQISHWQATLSALPWLVLMLAQLYRLGVSYMFRGLRLALACIAGVIAAGFLVVAVFPQNPLFAYSPDDLQALVQGPPIIDSLFLAYAMPGLILLAARLWLSNLDARISLVFLGIGAALLALYAGLEIRRLWQGNWLGGPGVEQGELYSYTIALMLLGAGLLFEAMRKGSTLLRRMAMGVIGLVIAKVFLIDAAGLTGLTRVFSFLGLGLSLAGLAWLNRWAGQASEKQG
ncbi:MAG: DUF2339 domain-containing protein [Paracoccaceae bacterium]